MADFEPSPTPKLSLFSFPSKQQNDPPTSMPTPPIHPLASVPFQWEEAPGKPRPCTTQSKPKSARCLQLPPRLLHEAKVSSLPSPTIVLDGPYLGRSLSQTTVSFGKGSLLFNGSENLGKKVSKERGVFGSDRWGSSRWKSNEDDVKGSFNDWSLVVNGCDGVDDDVTKVKITRIRRRSSFLSFSSSTRSHLLTSIYENIKLVVPWRRRQQKIRRMSQ